MILVVGDSCLDIYSIGKASRLSPEAPVPVLIDVHTDIREGMAGNVSENVFSLGGEQQLLTIRGRSQKRRIVAGTQQLVRLDYDSKDPLSKEQENHLIEQIPECDVAIISDYGKGVCTQAVIREVMNKAKRVLVDPYKTTPPEWYKGAFLIKANVQDCIKYDAPNIVMTSGDKGMYVNGIHLPAHAQEVIDVTGAGDTVIAALAVAISQGKTVMEAADFANKAAAIVVKKFGTSTCSLEELKE